MFVFKGNTVDVSTQKSFLTCVKSLRILAKFLGFLDGLPYRLDSVPSEIVLTAQINVREKVCIVNFSPHYITFYVFSLAVTTEFRFNSTACKRHREKNVSTHHTLAYKVPVNVGLCNFTIAILSHTFQTIILHLSHGQNH